MKRQFWLGVPVLLLIINGLTLLSQASDLLGYTAAQENEFLRLYVQEETAEFAVEDLATGKLWFSTPQNLSLERIKRGNARNAMRSLLVLNYFTPKREGRSLNSYVDSVLNDEFSVTIDSKEVRFDFTLGKQWSDHSFYPIFIAKDKFEALLEQVPDPYDREILLESYSLLAFEEKMEDPYERVSVFGLDLGDFFGNYEIEVLSGGLLQKKLGLRNEPYERTKHYLERLADTMVTFRADVERRGLLTAEDFKFVFKGPFYALLEETYAIYNRPEFTRIFSELGYTPQDVTEDHLQHGLDPPSPNPQVFDVVLTLKLEGPDLVVDIPAEKIIYPVDIPDDQGVLETFYPYSIDVLPYFGAAHQNSEGYLFVPECSGALIQITNLKKKDIPAYSGSIYGVDRSITPRIEFIGQGPDIYLPVFGLKEEERAFFTIIEKGAPLAHINAQSAGRTESFAKVFARFALTPRASITLLGVESSEDDKMVDAYAVVPYQGQIKLRISFLTGEHANYVGMANYYRQYLVEKCGLQKIDPDSRVPLVIELVGGFHDIEPVFGAPREVIRPMTTYREAVEVLQDLLARGVESIRLRYLGWSRGGIEHFYARKVTLEKALGTKTDFSRLLDYTKRNQVELYLDIDLNVVYRNTLFNGFRVGRDAARFLNRNAVKLWDYNLATFQRVLEREALVVSPRILGELTDSFLKSFSSYNSAHISLRRLGKEVFSDFVDRKERMVNRQKALDIAVEQMGKFTEAGYCLLIVGGNSASLPLATQIVEAPTEQSPLLIVDASVPFYQIVLQGYVDFSGQPCNVGGITRDKVLRYLETGELPFFRWSCGDSSLVKETFFDYLLATNYYDLVDLGLELYAEVAPVLQMVRGQAIVEHQKLLPGVFKTVYENGLEIVVNYNDEAILWDGQTVPGGGYTVQERSGFS